MHPGLIAAEPRYRAAGARERVAAYAAVALLAAAPGHALEWSYSPGFRLGAGQDTNQHMELENPREVGSATLSAGAEIAGRNEGFKFQFAPRVNAVGYDDEREIDRNDVYADIGVTQQREHASWSLTASRAQEGTLSSELENTDFFGVDVGRSQSALSTRWIRSGARGSFDLGVSAYDVDYDDRAVLTPFVDYRNRALQMGYGRAANERSTWRLGVTRFRVVNDFDLETSSTDVRATWSHVFARSLQARVGIGAFRASTEGYLGRTVTTGPAVDFSVDRDWPRWHLTAAGGRELKTEGRGTLQREDSVQLGMTRRISERFSVGAGWSAVRADSVGVLYSYDYLQSSVSLQWRFKRRWLFDGVFSERSRRSLLQPEVTGLLSQLSVSYRGLQ